MKWIIDETAKFKAYRIAPDLWLIRARSPDEEVFVYFDSVSKKIIWAAYNYAYNGSLKTWNVDHQEFKSFMGARNWEDEDYTLVPDRFLSEVGRALHNDPRYATERFYFSGNLLITSLNGNHIEWMLMVDSRFNAIDHDGQFFKMFYDYAARGLRHKELYK